MRRPDVVEHEQADRRGQIALLARLVDLTDHHRQRCLLGLRDFLQATPEGIFRLTLVLCPSMTMERLTTEDFIRASPKPPVF